MARRSWGAEFVEPRRAELVSDLLQQGLVTSLQDAGATVAVHPIVPASAIAASRARSRMSRRSSSVMVIESGRLLA